jgi:hypothetical protein
VSITAGKAAVRRLAASRPMNLRVVGEKPARSATAFRARLRSWAEKAGESSRRRRSWLSARMDFKARRSFSTALI